MKDAEIFCAEGFPALVDVLFAEQLFGYSPGSRLKHAHH